MSGRFLLDTNILIAIFAGDANVQQYLTQANEIFVPVVALGELYYGAGKSTRIEANTRRIDEFAANCTLLEGDLDTSRQYGQIKTNLRVMGRPIPENDIWIAATCLANEIPLLTLDKHFKFVPNIELIKL